MSAARKPITTWDAGELGIETGNTDRFTIMKMDEPAHEGKCEILEGASPEEKAEKLVTRLTEAKVI